MKILNLYAGIGGNRTLWGDDHDITAVELNPKVAAMYAERYPKDTVLVEDAHEYLLEHFREFDFIWASPPCPTHSRTRWFLKGQGIFAYPDMRLYQEILFLKHFFNGRWCIENVISYYEPLIRPQKVGRHYLWANFLIPVIPQPKDDIGTMNRSARPYVQQKANKKTQEERDAVNPELGRHVLECATVEKQKKLG